MNSIKILLISIIMAGTLVCPAVLCSALDAVTPGEFIIEPPTLICLGFEWIITGDDNRDASAAVYYREKSSSEWNEALPLLRIGNEPVSDMMNYITPNIFAGSIFDLTPDTEYECKFVMSDPDGVQGEKTKLVTVRTRKEPEAYDGGRVFHVYPPGYRGPKEEPSHTGVKSAYYGPGGDDWGLAAHAHIEPGDIILVHKGLYKSDRMNYSNPLGLTFHGTYVFTKDGTPEKPIVIKAAGDGEVIFDGDGCYRLFDTMAADNIHFEGFTIRNTDIAFYAGVKMVGGCSGLVVRNCRFEDIGIGVFTEYEGSKNFYIADNVMLGRESRTRLRGWNRSFWGKYGNLSTVDSFYGIKVYGQGHVICHNYIAYFHDGIDVHMYGTPEKNQDLKCVSIDIYNNDIFMVCDDVIESDGGEYNIRVFRNRGINTAQHGLSAQPIYGGPVYFIRNIIYHAVQGGAFKFNNHPSGLIVYHNTFCTEWNSGFQAYSNAHVRNNLFLGIDFPDRPVLRTATFTSYTSFDYNGYRPNSTAENNFFWKSPPKNKLQDFDIEESASYLSFKTLRDFSETTDQEKHGIIVDYNIFRNVLKPDPDDPGHVYQPYDLDFRLRPGSKAVDAGCILPNVNDEFSGNAPDLGAYETGKTVPVYGPRTRNDE
ncbi:MAG: hypothetical protein JXB48_14210 [Candidatus Latescibacteria bacterium]|nr:hypothetical protein [Candidatus Latescibacterota bacterium]